MNDLRVLGVDACARGWVGIASGADGIRGYFADRISDLVTAAEADGALGVVAIDMPIGLPDSGFRQADLLARKEIGALYSAVFTTPTRRAIQATDHATAVTVNRRLTGQGVSIQAFGLKPKLLQVDEWIRHTSLHVVEVHPEVSFARMAGTPLTDRKVTWAGAERRRELLAAAGLLPTSDLGAAGRNADVDDILDASAAAWTARRVLTNEAQSLPAPPEVFTDGHRAAIWY